MSNSFSTIGCPDIDLEPLTLSINGIDTKCDAIIADLVIIDNVVDGIDAKVDIVDTVVDGIDVKVDTIDTVVDNLTTTLNTVNTTVNTINSNTSGGGGGITVKFIGSGQASGTCPANKCWIATGNAYSNGGAGWGNVFSLKTAGQSSWGGIVGIPSYFLNQGPYWCFTLEYDA